MGVLLACVSAPCACLVPGKARRESGIPWTLSELPCSCWELNLGSQQKQSVLLTSESPFQLWSWGFLINMIFLFRHIVYIMFSYYILNMFRTELLIFLKMGSSYLGAFSLLEHWAVSRAFCLAGLEKERWMLLASYRQGLEVLPDVLCGVEQAPTTKFILAWNVRMPRLKHAFHDDQFLNYSIFVCLFSPHIFVVGLLLGFETDLSFFVNLR